jgi:hypothetical protein
MDVKHRVVLLLSCLAILGGCITALRVVLALVVGRIMNFWVFVGILLFAGFTVFLSTSDGAESHMPEEGLNPKQDSDGAESFWAQFSYSVPQIPIFTFTLLATSLSL